MAHVVCLIADPARAPLDHATVAAPPAAGAQRHAARWLAEDEACELPVDAGDGAASVRWSRRPWAIRPTMSRSCPRQGGASACW